MSAAEKEKYDALVRQYWSLREELRVEEGKYAGIQRTLLLYHNATWCTQLNT